MIRIAAGEALDFGQDDLRMEGWAVESRVYAEDPFRNFMPSTGRLVTYREPRSRDFDEGVSVRVDTGVAEGSEISMHYDPMIAKLVTHAADRNTAVAAMQQALDRYLDPRHQAQHSLPGLGHGGGALSGRASHHQFHRRNLSRRLRRPRLAGPSLREAHGYCRRLYTIAWQSATVSELPRRTTATTAFPAIGW